jgi:hypothetical protein
MRDRWQFLQTKSSRQGDGSRQHLSCLDAAAAPQVGKRNVARRAAMHAAMSSPIDLGSASRLRALFDAVIQYDGTGEPGLDWLRSAHRHPMKRVRRLPAVLTQSEQLGRGERQKISNPQRAGCGEVVITRPLAVASCASPRGLKKYREDYALQANDAIAQLHHGRRSGRK